MNRINKINSDKGTDVRKNEKPKIEIKEFKFISQSVEYRDGEMSVRKVTKNGEAARKEIERILGPNFLKIELP